MKMVYCMVSSKPVKNSIKKGSFKPNEHIRLRGA